MSEPFKWEVKPSLWEITSVTGEYSDRTESTHIVCALNKEMAWYSFLSYLIEIDKGSSYSIGTIYNWEDGGVNYRIRIGGNEDDYAEETHVTIIELRVLYTNNVNIDKLKEIEKVERVS